ncbi:hypothetical protein [Roseiterribacter gracilis]|uniref:Uncharacterized protein n=1 Tax=Roseiterribacter gracilis TaxID=2812848 RepID=A0A8S8XFQ1_9PROT|nr:hypothetical protein TMPK1_30590 [Rhodospirillales bacterium TMPK1]
MKSKSSPRRAAASSFDSRPLPAWAGRVAILAVVAVPALLFGTSMLTSNNPSEDLDTAREAIFQTAESQLAEFETGKGASPDDPKLRKVAASIAADRPSNPLLAAKQWVRSLTSKPDPCDEPALRKQLLRERIALVELESMTRAPIQRSNAETVLDRLDGNFDSRRYMVFVERCGLPMERWQPRISAARLEERALTLRGRIAQEFGPQFENQARSKRRSKA